MQSARWTQQGEPHPGLHALLGAAVTMLTHMRATSSVKASVIRPLMSLSVSTTSEVMQARVWDAGSRASLTLDCRNCRALL